MAASSVGWLSLPRLQQRQKDVNCLLDSRRCWHLSQARQEAGLKHTGSLNENQIVLIIRVAKMEDDLVAVAALLIADRASCRA